MRPPEFPAEERITLRRFTEQALEQLNLERGLGYTLKKLIVDPYGGVREYLFENRERMVKPLPLLLLFVGITTFLSFRYLHLDAEMAASTQNEEAMALLPENLRPAYILIANFVSQYLNIALISALPFTAAASFFVFRDQDLYYTEHLVINTYIYCIQTLFTIPVLPFIIQAPWISILILTLPNLYLVYAIKHVFEQSWMNGFIKSAGIYVLGQIGYNLFLIAVVLIISTFV